MPMSPTEKDMNFDKFISDFDKTLNKDTSTIKTITKSSATQGSGIEEEPEAPAKRTTSPSLATPTRPRRPSLSAIDKHPLNSVEPFEPELSEFRTPVGTGLKPVRLGSNNDNNNNSSNSSNSRLPVKSSGKPAVPTTTNSGGGLRRSLTMNSVALRPRSGSNSSTPKVGLNLNLPINKNKLLNPPATSRSLNRSPSKDSITSPFNTPVPAIANTVASSTGAPLGHRRTRTNSTASSTASLQSGDDVSESLRQLALKEMRVIELKDELRLIQQKLELEEKELKKLKHKVQMDLYRDLSPSTHPQAKFKNNVQQHTPTPSLGSLRDSPGKPKPKPKPKSAAPKTEQQQQPKESVWTKPITFLNQFDQMLQNEFEKMAKFDEVDYPATSAEDSNANDRSPSKPIKNLVDSQGKSVNEEVMNSIWSFVSDVKQGLLGPEDIPEEDEEEELLPKARELEDLKTK